MKTHKLKFMEKCSYAVGGMPDVMSNVLAAFLTMFYTDSIGMAAGAVGTMFLISRVFDGVTDLIAGSIIDRTKTRWGKARPWILWLSVPVGLALALIFFISPGGSAMNQLIYAFVTYNLFNSVMYTMVACARYALMPLMTQDEGDRVSLSKYNTLFGLAITMVGSAVTFPFVSRMGGDVTAWRIVFAVYGFVMTVSLLFCFATSKEHINPALNGDGEKNTDTEVTFAEGIKIFFGNKYSLFALLNTFLIMVAVNISNSSQAYFYTYSMNDQSLTTSMNMVALIPMIIGCLLLPNLLLNKIGLKKMVYIGTGAHVIFSIGMGLASQAHSVPLLAVCLALKNLSVGCLSVPIGIIAAIGVDYGEYKFHKRIDGFGSSVVTCGQKIAVGLVSAGIGWTLELTGYVANQVQTASVVTEINFLFCYVPAIACAIVAVLFRVFYHYDEEGPVVVAELERRRKEGEL